MGIEIGLQLFTNENSFPLPDHLKKQDDAMPVRVPSKFDTSSLSDLVNHLIGMNESFDFLVNGQFLRTTLDEYLAETKTSPEQLLNVEYILAVTKPKLSKQYGTDEWIKSLHFTNEKLYSGSFDGVLRVHSESSSVVATHENTNINKIQSNTAAIVTAGQNGEIRFWDKNSLELKAIGIGHDSSVESLTCTDAYTVSGNFDGNILIYKTPKFLQEASEAIQLSHKKRKVSSNKIQPSLVLNDHSGCVSSLVHINSTLYSGGWDHTIRKYDSEYSLQDTCKFDTVVTSLCGETSIISGHSDGVVRSFDFKSGQSTHEFVKQPNQISSVQLKRNIVASACYDGNLRFFDIRNTQSILYTVQIAKNKKLFDMEWYDRKIAVAGECADLFIIDAPQ